jgi:hypothetical protein
VALELATELWTLHVNKHELHLLALLLLSLLFYKTASVF